MHRIIRWFGRLTVAAVLLLILLVVAALGTFFPQRPVASPEALARWEEMVRARYGALTGLLEGLGFFRWPQSPLLWTTLVLVGLATVLCTLSRWHAVWRAFRRGTLLIHLAVPLLLLALVLTRLGWQEEWTVHPGETISLTAWRGLSLRCDEVMVDRYPDGSIADYRVTISVLARDGEIRRGVVRFNVPLPVGDAAVFLSGYTVQEGRPAVTLRGVRDPGYGLFGVAGGLLVLGLVLSLTSREGVPQ